MDDWVRVTSTAHQQIISGTLVKGEKPVCNCALDQS